MRAIFWQHAEHERERALANALAVSARTLGDTVEIRDVEGGVPEIVDCDLMMKVGVKSRDWFRAYAKAGIPWCYFDKGYDRHRAAVWMEYWRVSVNGHQPVSFVEKAKKDSKRADESRLHLTDWIYPEEGAVIVDGSSSKHWYFHSDKHFETKAALDAWANKVVADYVAEVKAATTRKIIFRPKPSWHRAMPIVGTEFSGGKLIGPVLQRAHALVTYGSNCCVDAVCAGVPAIVLGDGIARPISSISLRDIGQPRRASMSERRQWLNNCAWCQFDMDEYASGVGWRIIREMIDYAPL